MVTRIVLNQLANVPESVKQKAIAELAAALGCSISASPSRGGTHYELKQVYVTKKSGD